MSYVYIAPLVNKKAFKIGKADDPTNRLALLTRYYEFDFKEISLINCGNIIDAYRIENLLHAACENKRVIFEYDGGTEFFDYVIYDKLLSIVNNLVEINQFQIEKIAPISSIKNVTLVQDDIDCLLNALTRKMKNKRLSYNISQEKLAKITGVSLNTIKNTESTGNVTLVSFVKILKALDLDSILSEFEVETPLRKRCR